MNKDDYQKTIDEINENIEVLFKLNPQTHNSKFKVERLRLIESLYKYVEITHKSNSNLLDKQDKNFAESYGVEIFEVADSCIRNYEKENGDFLNYFNHSLKIKCNGVYKHKKHIDYAGGIIIKDKNIKKIIKLYLNICKVRSEYEVTEEIIKIICDNYQLEREEVRECLKKYKQLNMIQQQYKVENNEGGEVDIFDTIVDFNDEYLKIEDDQIFMEILQRINTVFVNLQDRTKEKNSKILTLKLYGIIYENKQKYEFAKKTGFFDNDFYQQQIISGNITTSAGLSEYLEVKESDISRTYKNFIEKCKEDEILSEIFKEKIKR